MGSTPINKIDWHLEVFFRVPSPKFYFVIFIIKVFIGMLGESFEIQFLAIFIRNLIKFEIEFLFFLLLRFSLEY